MTRRVMISLLPMIPEDMKLMRLLYIMTELIEKVCELDDDLMMAVSGR